MQTLLVLGNHDEHAGTPPEEWGVKVVEEPWPLSPAWSGRAGRAGRGGRASRVGSGETVPCFHVESVTVLPAFGLFTGFKRIQTEPGDRVVLVTPQGVAALPI